MIWLESIRCFKMDDLMMLIVPLSSPTGWCSLILLCSCLVVRPIYRTPQGQVNLYIHIEVVKRGNVSLRLNLSIGDPVTTNFSWTNLNVLVILRFSFVLSGSVIISFLNGNLINRVFLGTVIDVFVWGWYIKLIWMNVLRYPFFNRMLCNSINSFSVVSCVHILRAR